MAQDIYLSSVDNQPRTSIWWSPVSFEPGFVLDRVFYGGTNMSAAQLAFANNANGVLDRFISLGPLNGNYSIGQFYAPTQHPNFPAPVNQWFTLMMHVSGDGTFSGFGYSLWVKTQDTIASNPPFIDPRMAVGDIPPIDGNPTGWVNTYPGFPDDLFTSNVIEGIGIGASDFGTPSPTTAPLNQSPMLASTAFDGIQYGRGLDDPLDSTFQTDDYFFGPVRVRGVRGTPPCVADLNLDKVVDGTDLARLLNNWGPAGVIQEDFNGDGVIDGADLSAVLNTFGPCL